MKTRLLKIFFCLTCAALLPTAEAQFTFTTNNGAITITGYNTAAGYNVVIPASTNGYPVTRIGNSAFSSKNNITNISIPNSITNIGIGAFQNCSSLTSITIPSSITIIGSGAFANCAGLISVTIQNGISEIGASTFAYCYNLASVSIPDSVTNIDDYAFYDCSSLMNVTIPNKINNIGSLAFCSCHLTNVMIPNSVTSIGDQAFEGCSDLTTVTVGNGVTNLGVSAFGYCVSLNQVYFQGNAPTVDGEVGSVDTTVFSEESGTAFYLTSTTGWNSTFGGWPTAAYVLPPPPLGVSTYSSQPAVFFPTATGTNYVLQMTTNLASGNWVTVSNGYSITGIVVTNAPPAAFFRLH